jgi:hypothetical protein
MKKIFVLILLFCAAAFGQHKFEIKNASRNYDAQIEVKRVEEKVGSGKLNVTLFKRNSQKQRPKD